MKAYIYLLKSPQTDKVYIGHTHKSLSARLYKHKMYKPNYISSWEIVQYDDCGIECLETIESDNFDDIIEAEGKHQQQYSNCVNKCINGKEHREKYMNEYKIQHKEETRKKNREWYSSHKEYRKEYNELYREKNKEILKAKRQVKIKCAYCDDVLTKASMKRHIKRKHSP